MNISIEISVVDNLKFSNTGFNVLGPAWLVQKCFQFRILFGILENLLQVLLVENTNNQIQTIAKSQNCGTFLIFVLFCFLISDYLTFILSSHCFRILLFQGPLSFDVNL